MHYIILELETCPPHCALYRRWPSCSSQCAFPCRNPLFPHPPPRSQHHPPNPHG